MIRRAIAAFRRQDWIAVAIELLVVILGVFIGVQASNWNAERETNRKAAVFTERLTSDLLEEAWGYELQVAYYGEVLGYARRTLDALSGKAPLSDEDLLISAYRATQYNGNVRAKATYEELTSTGEIGLIRDRGLRDLAMRVYTATMFDDIVLGGQNAQYRVAFRKAIPHEVQHALGESCGDRINAVGDYDSIGHSLDYPCSPELSKEAVAQSAAILRGSTEIAPLLRLRIADIETDLGNLTVYYQKDMRDPLRKLAGRSR